MRKLLHSAKRVANRLLGTGSDVLFWRLRHYFHRRWADAYTSDAALAHPHRRFLVEAVARWAPRSVLEIGCASGPNLYLLAQRLPNARMVGIDVSASAVRTGRRWMAAHRLANVTFETGNALHLERIPSKSFDVIVTDAVLIYVAGNRIRAVLKELVRIARTGAVLVEWVTDESDSAYVGNWAHNYRALLAEIAPGTRVETSRITADVWPGQWATHGGVVVATLAASATA